MMYNFLLQKNAKNETIIVQELFHFTDSYFC